jgi:hypothetical protein
LISAPNTTLSVAASPIVSVPPLNVVVPVTTKLPPTSKLPEISTAPLISIRVALSSISSVAAMSKVVPLGALMYCVVSLKNKPLAPFKRRPASARCVIVTSWSFPKAIRAPSARKRSLNSKDVVPSEAPSEASGTKAVVAVIVVACKVLEPVMAPVTPNVLDSVVAPVTPSVL